MKDIILRKMKLSDLELFYELNKPTQLFHSFNGPYFKKETDNELKIRIEKMRVALKNNKHPDNSMVIADKEDDTIVGSVSWYWKSQETNWMEIGIVIFNNNYWGMGIGYKALKKWIALLFDERKDLVRLGLTTWSGNKRMIHLAEKLNFKCEATYRKARIVDGKYYDSVSYGILREEFEK